MIPTDKDMFRCYNMRKIKSMRISDKIFRPYDVRGEFPVQINERTGYLLARAFVRVLGDDTTLVVGRDGKNSSQAIEDGFIKGLIEAGQDVVHLGLCSSPMLYWAVAHLGLDGGAIITASHVSNENYTGIKMVKKGGVPMRVDEMRDLIEDDELNFTKREGGSVEERDLLQEYVEELKGKVRIPKMKIVMDAGGGMVGPVLKEIFKDAIPLFWDIDPDEPPHNLDVTLPESRELLVKEVKKSKADMGFIWDEDGDRFFVVDSRGQVVDPNIVALLLAQYLTEEGDRVVVDIRSSRMMESELEGREVVWSKTWHPEIKDKMREVGAVFGSETSGHYIFEDLYFIDDGVLAALYFLEAVKSIDLEEYVDELEKRYHILPEERFEAGEEVLDRVAEFYKDEKITREDGVTVWGKDWKLNLRFSKTEPILKLNIDAPDEKALQDRRAEVVSIIPKK